MITAERYHDFDAGHRVVNHESKCRHLHGHTYRAHFAISSDSLDGIGRVIDFSVIKSKLAMWLEDNWDHRMIIWAEDPMLPSLLEVSPESIQIVPFNPTAENMAKHLVEVVGPKQLSGTGATLVEVRLEETRKCSARYSLKH